MLLVILNKLDSVDVLYSLIGVHTTLDRLARDITFTQSIDLVRILSNEQNNSGNKSIFDRFCFDILPQIQHNIECLTLDSLSTDRVLYIGNYPKLHKLTLVNLPLDMASRIFNSMFLLSKTLNKEKRIGLLYLLYLFRLFIICSDFQILDFTSYCWDS
jgi:hypothetical protein